MTLLTSRDQQALSECLAEVYGLCTLDDFPAQAIRSLHRVVAADLITYNEILPPRTLKYVWDPAHDAPPSPAQDAAFARDMHENPILAHYLENGHGQAVKISDFLGVEGYHRTGLYNEAYKCFGVESQLGISLRKPSASAVIGLALNRGLPDFTERDRALLDILRGHLSQAYANAALFTKALQAPRVVEGWPELEMGLIVADPAGRVVRSAGAALVWMDEMFGFTPGGRLPDTLRDWVKSVAGTRRRADVANPLVLELERCRIDVRFIEDVRSGEYYLMFERQMQRSSVSRTLRDVGLSRREAEVLSWVARGKTDADVAVILGLSVRTVHKHLEHIYTKLGVENRTAAAIHLFGAGPRGALPAADTPPARPAAPRA